jgi:hypothetical protein
MSERPKPPRDHDPGVYFESKLTMAQQRQARNRKELEIIRAFVERVEKRKGESGEGRFGYRQRVLAELAAMERAT